MRVRERCTGDAWLGVGRCWACESLRGGGLHVLCCGGQYSKTFARQRLSPECCQNTRLWFCEALVCASLCRSGIELIVIFVFNVEQQRSLFSAGVLLKASTPAKQ